MFQLVMVVLGLLADAHILMNTSQWEVFINSSLVSQVAFATLQAPMVLGAFDGCFFGRKGEVAVVVILPVMMAVAAFTLGGHYHVADDALYSALVALGL